MLPLTPPLPQLHSQMIPAAVEWEATDPTAPTQSWSCQITGYQIAEYHLRRIEFWASCSTPETSVLVLPFQLCSTPSKESTHPSSCSSTNGSFKDSDILFPSLLGSDTTSVYSDILLPSLLGSDTTSVYLWWTSPFKPPSIVPSTSILPFWDGWPSSLSSG